MKGEVVFLHAMNVYVDVDSVWRALDCSHFTMGE